MAGPKSGIAEGMADANGTGWLLQSTDGIIKGNSVMGIPVAEERAIERFFIESVGLFFGWTALAEFIFR